MKSTFGVFAGIVAAAFILSGCATPTGGSVSVDWEEPVSQSDPPEPKVAKKNGPPPHAKAHGYRAKHSYRYYPNECIYYDSKRNLYFYLEKDGWTIGVSLPSHIKLSNDYVTVRLETDKPYEYYEEHSEKYPPQKKKRKKRRVRIGRKNKHVTENMVNQFVGSKSLGAHSFLQIIDFPTID